MKSKFDNKKISLKKYKNSDLIINNAKGSALAKLVAENLNKKNKIVIITPDFETANDTAIDISFYKNTNQINCFPPWEILPNETDKLDTNIAASQINLLKKLQKNTLEYLTIPITAVLQPLVSPKIVQTEKFAITPNLKIEPEKLVEKLVAAGWENITQVYAPGQFSRRGGIIDVYPLLSDAAYRIEFFGDEIETIRIIDLETQESSKAITTTLSLLDISQQEFIKAFSNIEKFSIFDYFSSDSQVVMQQPEKIEKIAHLYLAGRQEQEKYFFDYTWLKDKIANYPTYLCPDINYATWDANVAKETKEYAILDLETTGWERLRGGLEQAIVEVKLLLEKNIFVNVVAANAQEEKRLKELLAEKDSEIVKKLQFTVGELTKGFVYNNPKNGFAVITDHELLNRYGLRRNKKVQIKNNLLASFMQLNTDDYVVHINNGIAKYEGLKKLSHGDAEEDYLVLRFAEDSRIYVPVSEINLVQRYVGVGESRPQLTKLGSSTWQKKKQAVEKAVKNVAADLLKTQAERKTLQGIKLPPDDQLVKEFNASFPYQETPDQLVAMDEIKEDQQSSTPMDRLLCGDVGFGKTEVAIRAAFRAVNAGKQVAVLVPTTILAEQHYRTFAERMADYPVNVAGLSRFRDSKEQKIIVDNLKEGLVDIVIGTHRLLSADIGFKDLGLIIIDEEQKFGVEHKERLKKFRKEVDVLTMTATPIPRTLNMAMLGLRDISSLATAPYERQAVKTLVVRWADMMVRRAILNELARSGQCYFLHNRVYNIYKVADKLAELVPEARIAVGHGQMPEKELLMVMNEFIEGKIDVLVCTTIIESGVDIPNVNTLLVNEADHFGLSELHQLRGRVGRYKHQAFAYFLIPPKRPVTPEGQKRLQALEEYSELGAGFRIALRDLEIRGAGNILGVEQSGHIHMVGFDLYCQLLEEAVARLKGENKKEKISPQVNIITNTYVDKEYIPTENQRLDFYRKIINIDSIEELKKYKNYIRDRYGVMPAGVENCFNEQQIKIFMAEKGITYLAKVEKALIIDFSEDNKMYALASLKKLGNKITPYANNRWRIELNNEEDKNINVVVERIFTLVGQKKALNFALIEKNIINKKQENKELKQPEENKIDIILQEVKEARKKRQLGKKESTKKEKIDDEKTVAPGIKLEVKLPGKQKNQGVIKINRKI